MVTEARRAARGRVTRRTRRGPVIFATDLSSASRRAFPAALSWAGRYGARLDIVHVLTPPSPFILPSGMDAPTWRDLEARARQIARRYLARLAAAAARSGVRAATHLSSGTPEVEIVRIARQRRADVVVIGTHGRTGVNRAFMGSVAARIVQAAGCPVLTVRGAARRG